MTREALRIGAKEGVDGIKELREEMERWAEKERLAMGIEEMKVIMVE